MACVKFHCLRQSDHRRIERGPSGEFVGLALRQTQQLQHPMKLGRAQPIIIRRGSRRVGAGLPEKFHRRAKPRAVPRLVGRCEFRDASHREFVRCRIRPRDRRGQQQQNG